MKYNDKYRGIIIGSSIILGWFVHLVWLFSVNLSELSLMVITGVILIQAFLFVGLFITAHDAMHGSISPRNKKINNWFGILAATLYAFFSFKKLKTNHFAHHKNPGTSEDPDYYANHENSFFHWFYYFLKKYMSGQQVLALAVLLNILHHILHIPLNNLLLFWILPSLISSLQLFYFGTYLPHKEPKEGYTNQHHAKSVNIPPFFSFLACYHFGYHWEHHEYSFLPWWKLPSVRKK